MVPSVNKSGPYMNFEEKARAHSVIVQDTSAFRKISGSLKNKQKQNKNKQINEKSKTNKQKNKTKQKPITYKPYCILNCRKQNETLSFKLKICPMI